jgi:hypothetical protein
MATMLSPLEDINECFYHLLRYSVLLCKEHRTGVLNLGIHLRSFHSVTNKLGMAIMQHFHRQPITGP